MTVYSKLLEEGRIKRGRFSRKQVEDCLAIAKRDIATARTVLETSPEWALNIAYNAMQQAGRAFMFSKGYRTDGEAHHATVVQFLEIALGREYEDALAIMDRMRRKRNRANYDTVGPISDKEAHEAVSIAEEFMENETKSNEKDDVYLANSKFTQPPPDDTLVVPLLLSRPWTLGATSRSV